ncbi:MAG TPA: hypothetical protein PK970_06975 [Hyphomicrobiaceae bacterium]|nr:hypothetical protein [Hyphomicrobiaceae bacterium]
MISYEDCIALCGLTRDQIEAIAEHEHVPEIVAAALGQYLLHKAKGPLVIRNMIIDDIRAAQAAGDRDHTQRLLHVLHRFLREHPEAR